MIGDDLKTALVSGVSVLESGPDDQKGWHPGSNKQVLDLVHPSLYGLVIGRSPVRSADTTSADPVHVITEEEYISQRPDFDNYDRAPWAISPLYQWLPTDFAVSDSGDVKPLSYINNLHPIRHRALYPTISSILSRFVPLFERVLSDMLNREPPLAIQVDPTDWYCEVPEYVEDEEAAEESHDDEDPEEKWDREKRWPHIPEPAPFSPPSPDGRV